MVGELVSGNHALAMENLSTTTTASSSESVEHPRAVGFPLSVAGASFSAVSEENNNNSALIPSTPTLDQVLTNVGAFLDHDLDLGDQLAELPPSGNVYEEGGEQTQIYDR